jgi:hypothetical protein
MVIPSMPEFAGLNNSKTPNQIDGANSMILSETFGKNV